MKIIYENCRVKNYMKEDHRTYRRNFCSCDKKAFFSQLQKVASAITAMIFFHIILRLLLLFLFVCLFTSFNISVLWLLTWCTIWWLWHITILGDAILLIWGQIVARITGAHAIGAFMLASIVSSSTLWCFLKHTKKYMNTTTMSKCVINVKRE